jgi:hypothetical protein
MAMMIRVSERPSSTMPARTNTNKTDIVPITPGKRNLSPDATTARRRYTLNRRKSCGFHRTSLEPLPLIPMRVSDRHRLWLQGSSAVARKSSFHMKICRSECILLAVYGRHEAKWLRAGQYSIGTPYDGETFIGLSAPHHRSSPNHSHTI